LAPVTVVSADTRTWLEIGSTDHAVPVILAERCSSAVAALSWVALRVTNRGTAPVARTDSAVAAS